MILAVADTHAAIWYAQANPGLSPAAKAVFDTATHTGQRIAVSSISLCEVVYLVEKRKVHPDTLDHILALLDLDELLVEVRVDRTVALAMKRIDRSQVPDMPDRIIAATALSLSVPLISRDRKIQASNVPTVW